MPSLEQVGPSIAIGLLIVVMLWFTFGTQRNIRKGNALVGWLQGGLPRIGRRSTLRWLGSSAVELQIANATPPFREATVLIVLEPRDVAPLWAFARSRGRRDFLIVRANLVRAPRFSVDVADPRGWTGHLDDSEPETDRTDWGDGRVAIVGPGADQDLIRRTWRDLVGASEGVWRLTIQPVVPHLEIHVRPRPSADVPADRLLGPIHDLAAALVAR